MWRGLSTADVDSGSTRRGNDPGDTLKGPLRGTSQDYGAKQDGHLVNGKTQAYGACLENTGPGTEA